MDYTVTKDEFIISTDKSKLDMDYVHGFLSNSYWSPGMPIETVKEQWKAHYVLECMLMINKPAGRLVMPG